MWPEVIIHDLPQAKAALRAAHDLGLEIRLRSAPGAAGYAGIGYLHALGEAAGHPLLIDCDDDPGLVMAALRTGCQQLVFAGASDIERRLSEMAERHGATIRGPSDRQPPCLALSPADDDRLIRSWLLSRTAS